MTMQPASVLLVPVGVLAAGALLEGLLARLLSARAKGWLAFAASLAALGGVLAVWPGVGRAGSLGLNLAAWDGPISLAYRVDGLSQLFALMGVAIGAAVLLYSVSYMARDASATRFYVLMLVFIAGLVNLVYSADLFLMYLSWEVIGLCSFLLVGFWYRDREAAAGARKVLVMTHLAGYGLLAAVLLIFARTGATLWTDPRVAAAFDTGLFLLVALAAFAKSVQFPLHTWIPDAMAAPTPVSSLLHAACYVKAGVYLVARLHSLGPWPDSWQHLVIWVGTVTLLAGALFAMVQSDLKRLLAFSTVSQIGYMMLGLGLGTPLGIAAGLLHCLNHGFFKGGLFLCAGAVQHSTGTRDMDLLGGLGRRMPKTMFLWLVGAAAISGVPLFSGFVSKWLLYNAALEAGYAVPALVSWAVSVITVFYFLKATTGVFFGDESPLAAKSREASPTMIAGASALAAGSILLGVAPQLAVRYVINPLLPALGVRPVIGVSWLGLTAGTGSWFTTAGLVLALLAVGLGVAVYAAARRSRGAAPAPAPAAASLTFSGGEPLSGPARLPASDFSLIIKKGLAPFYRLADPDRYYLALWRAALKAAALLGRINGWLEKRAAPAIIIGALLAGGLAAAFVARGDGTMGRALPSAVRPAAVCAAAAFLALISSSRLISGPRKQLPLMALSGGLALAGLLVGAPLIRLLALEGAAFVALALVWRTTGEKAAARAYTAAVVISAAAMIAGSLGLEAGGRFPALPLILAGFAVKLALVPLHFWLPPVAEKTPAPVVGLVVAVVDVAAFGELVLLREASPGLFAPAWPWLFLAALSAFGGAALMLAQKDIKRLLAFSTIEDMGYLVVGVAAGGALGLTGAVLGAAVHALAKGLLFSSLAVVEAQGGSLALASGGTASRFPWSGAGFAVGALAMLGLPPTLGYAARWRLYGAAHQAGTFFLVILILSTALAVLAYSRVLALYWWGPGDGEKKKREPAYLVLAVVGLAVALLVLGLWPKVFTG